MSKVFKSAKDVENYHTDLGYSEKFCINPFTTLLLEPDGSVGACRHKGTEFPVGNILQNSFEEIWNGPFIKNWRADFLSGNPTICKTEVRDQHCNHCPSYSSIIDAAEIKIQQTKKPLRLAFNFNGHCNLECQMCHVWQLPNGLYDRINFWDQLDAWIENLEEVELLSGEPFIQKDTYKLINLISTKKPNARWSITTNANWKLTGYIKDHLNKINIKNIIISLDSLNEENYKVIRKKGNLNLALQTITDLQQYDEWRVKNNLGRLNIKINFLFQQVNWQELGAVHDFSKNKNVEIFRTFLYEPEKYSLLSLSETERIKILDWYFANLTLEQILNGARIINTLLLRLPAIDKMYFYDKYATLLKNKNAPATDMI